MAGRMSLERQNAGREDAAPTSTRPTRETQLMTKFYNLSIWGRSRRSYSLIRAHTILKTRGAYYTQLGMLFVFTLLAVLLFANSAWAQQGLSIRMEGPSKVAVGEAFTYTLTVSKAGSGKASNVIVEDTLPKGVIVDSLPSNCHASRPDTNDRIKA